MYIYMYIYIFMYTVYLESCLDTKPHWNITTVLLLPK